MVLDTTLLNTQQYKVRIEGKVEQSRERSSALPYTSVLKLLKREPFGCLRRRSPTLLTYLLSKKMPDKNLELIFYTHFLSTSVEKYSRFC